MGKERPWLISKSYYFPAGYEENQEESQ